jgi:hypothetical protein
MYMPDLLYLVTKWWKQICLVVFFALLTVGLIVFLQPRKYLSTATALPVSTVSTDKARIFNENIEGLYSALGNSDDLDMIIGTAQLDTVYLAMTDQFNLIKHYKVKGIDSTRRARTAILLRKRSQVIKSEYGELKIKVWDRDKQLAAVMANTLLDRLQTLHQRLKSESNMATLSGLEKGQYKIQAVLDSIGNLLRNRPADAPGREILVARQTALTGQLTQYEKLIGEYQLMVDSKPPALLIVERARPAIKADKPRRLEIMAVTAFLSVLFGLFTALVLERRQANRK